VDVETIEEFGGSDWMRDSNISVILEDFWKSPHSKGSDKKKFFLKVVAQLKVEEVFC
jgi:hypothetical protein